MFHPFMDGAARGLAERGIATLRYQFPYMERGAKRPDPLKTREPRQTRVGAPAWSLSIGPLVIPTWLVRRESKPQKSEASGDDEADPAEPHRYRPVPDVNWPAHINPHQVEQRHQGED